MSGINLLLPIGLTLFLCSAALGPGLWPTAPKPRENSLWEVHLVGGERVRGHFLDQQGEVKRSFRTLSGEDLLIRAKQVRRIEVLPRVALVYGRRRPCHPELEARARQMLKLLDHPRGMVRARAEIDLIGLGRPIRGLLRKALLMGSPEARLRAGRALRKIAEKPFRLNLPTP